jgi:crotonobetainyl-CoA:carnitine CoA-transferase CaiB-like acyl-CoA transferase
LRNNREQSPQRFLGDVRVLDLSQYIPGPFATRQLADLGAEVIKVEPPAGDPMRRFMHNRHDSISAVYRHLNRGKRICRLDLKSNTGKQSLQDLIVDADVLLESYRPGVLKKLGFGRDALSRLNPRLIHCALSGYGQTGPYRLRAGHDVNYCAASGSAQVSGISERPVIGYPPIVDHAGAMQASIAILGALHAREHSGEGAFLDISLFETILSWQYFPLLNHEPDRAESLINGGAACYNIYQCEDGQFVSLGAVESHFWQRFCETLARPQWIGRQFETMPQHDLIDEVSRLISLNSSDHWNRLFATVDCCFEAVIFPDEPASHPQIKARNSLTDSGPAYPGMIDDEPVFTDNDLFEFDADETPRWRGI